MNATGQGKRANGGVAILHEPLARPLFGEGLFDKLVVGEEGSDLRDGVG